MTCDLFNLLTIKLNQLYTQATYAHMDICTDAEDNLLSVNILYSVLRQSITQSNILGALQFNMLITSVKRCFEYKSTHNAVARV